MGGVIVCVVLTLDKASNPSDRLGLDNFNSMTAKLYRETPERQLKMMKCCFAYFASLEDIYFTS